MLSFSRRKSIKLISGALGVPFLSPCAPQPEVLRFGVIGCGDLGDKLINGFIGLDKRIVIHAVCDIWERRLCVAVATAKSISKSDPRSYVDYAEMLQQESKNLDAVVIASPDHFHEEHAVACLKAGLHVFCASPLAHSSSSARRIAAVAKQQSSAVLYVPLSLEVDAFLEYVKKEIIEREHLFGELLAIDSELYILPPKRNVIPSKRITVPSSERLAKYGYQSLEEYFNWRVTRRFGLDFGIRLFIQRQASVIRYFLGRNPVSLSASRSIISNQNEDIRSLCVTLEYASTGGTLQCTARYFPFLNESPYLIRIMGEYGLASWSLPDRYVQQVSMIDRTEQRGIILDKWKDVYKRGVLGEAAEQRKQIDGYIPPPFGRDHDGKFYLPIEPPYHRFDYHLKCFINAVFEKSIAQGDVQDYVDPIILAEHIEQAIVTGKKMTFDSHSFA